MHFLELIQCEEYKDMKTVELAALVQSRIAGTIETDTI